MANPNDLGILISTLINQQSKQNVIKEVDTLITTLQQKLNNLKINIGGAGLQQLVSQLNQINKISQNIKTPHFDFNQSTAELQKFHSKIASVENTLEATGRRVTSTWDEFGKVTMNVTSTATGLVEKYKYQWDAVNQTLIRVNRQQLDNIGSVETLTTKYKGMIDSLKNGKLGSFVDQSSLKSFENSLKNIQVLDSQITTDLQRQFNQIKQNAQAFKDQVNSAKSLSEQLRLMQATNSNNFKNFEGSQTFSSLNSQSLSQYNALKQQIQSITTATPDAIQQLRLLGKQFDELKIKAQQGFNLGNQEQLLQRTVTQMNSEIQKFQRQYSGLYDTTKLKQIQNDLNNLRISPNLNNDIANLRTNFTALRNEAYSTSTGLNQANKQIMSLGDALSTAAQKFGIWITMSTLIMGAIHQISEAFDYILEQSKLFTNLQMEMTNKNLNFSEVTQSALDYAKAMGTTSSEVMKAISVFGKCCPL